MLWLWQTQSSQPRLSRQKETFVPIHVLCSTILLPTKENGPVKQTRGFLGFGNFYRRFIRHFSNIAKPLNDLLKKDQKFDWTSECQDAFKELKKHFTEEPVLIIPDHTKPFQIECNTSKYASGAVLTQLDANGDRHPCAFISKTFSPTERNYEIYDRELLAIIRALEEWRHYLQGLRHTTIILSTTKT